MLFDDKIEGKTRTMSMVLKMSKEEKEFLIQEAKRKGVSIVSLLRKCIRDKLRPGHLRTPNV